MIYTKRILKTAQSGFTLVEVLIVLAILGALAAIGGYAFNTYRNNAARSATRMSLHVLKTSIEQFEVHTGRFPNRLRDLVSNKGLDEDVKRRWQGPYIEKVPLDGWNRDFKYKITQNEKRPYQLYSYGKTGVGAPKEEWISVWDI